MPDGQAAVQAVLATIRHILPHRLSLVVVVVSASAATHTHQLVITDIVVQAAVEAGMAAVPMVTILIVMNRIVGRMAVAQAMFIHRLLLETIHRDVCLTATTILKMLKQ